MMSYRDPSYLAASLSSDEDDDDVIYLPALTASAGAEDQEDIPFPFSPTIHWPIPSAKSRKLVSRASTESLGNFSAPSGESEAAFHFHQSHGVRRIRSLGPGDKTQVGRLRQRRAAVSAATSIDQPGVNESTLEEGIAIDQFGMPMKKNTMRITARFIGSLQKHSAQKSKAERVAKAAALATYLSNPRSKESDGGVLCDPCSDDASNDKVSYI
uniref:Rap1 GTPase-activating protein 1 n=1 Tax=Phallusia mammillata TaxID=59560 RepID=A0A6F9DPR6_9ASCI|nr:rap1 GTPase-activating protein 1 [Phallusia mammillata]